MPAVESPPELEVQSPKTTQAVPDTNGFVSRDEWLAQAGKFKEKVIGPFDGLGKVLIVEVSGLVRAQIQSQQSRGLLAESRSVDAVSYQRALILAGVADPGSPAEARRPLFQAGDMDRVMGIGGGTIQAVVSELEKLSGLGAEGAASAEGNSSGTLSDAGIS